jgi:hypothetical protein
VSGYTALGFAIKGAGMREEGVDIYLPILTFASTTIIPARSI